MDSVSFSLSTDGTHDSRAEEEGDVEEEEEEKGPLLVIQKLMKG